MKKEAAFENWTPEHAKKTWESLGGSFEACASKARTFVEVDDPNAYCAGLQKAATGKSPREAWLTISEVEKLCPPCASKMKSAGMVKVRLSHLIERMDIQHRVAKVTEMIKASKLSKESIKKIKATVEKTAQVHIDADQFASYEVVRRSGLTNMYAVNTVMDLANLTKDEVMYIMKNYKELHDKYMPLLNENDINQNAEDMKENYS